MSYMTRIGDMARFPGDPTVLTSGNSSRGFSDNMAKRLGWFSIALGATQLFATKKITRSFGVPGREKLVATMGLREIGQGILCLSTEQRPGVWSRVAGDVMDIAVLSAALKGRNRKKTNVGLALAAVAGITLIDLATAKALNARHSRGRGEIRDYSDRSGWPNGRERSQGAATDFKLPEEYQAEPQVAKASRSRSRKQSSPENIQDPGPITH